MHISGVVTPGWCKGNSSQDLKLWQNITITIRTEKISKGRARVTQGHAGSNTIQIQRLKLFFTLKMCWKFKSPFIIKSDISLKAARRRHLEIPQPQTFLNKINNQYMKLPALPSLPPSTLCTQSNNVFQRQSEHNSQVVSLEATRTNASTWE